MSKENPQILCAKYKVLLLAYNNVHSLELYYMGMETDEMINQSISERTWRTRLTGRWRSRRAWPPSSPRRLTRGARRPPDWSRSAPVSSPRRRNQKSSDEIRNPFRFDKPVILQSLLRHWTDNTFWELYLNWRHSFWTKPWYLVMGLNL